ncbi:3-phosphoserine/phosphohydroxythreonine transaminase [Chengkuizengella sediminis]|uniref:3-phosphoserine/phosphohydroxythreonine transaminase n=1 Tax=Chengkuizengella sediminis TaxID=1885917 RepID=UPI001389CD10|nr:3-phosphoserine/phosphohydroxythreonine transaminase [Chengkuizengella sediminis]NDI35852.1 3-phosphoserine/phosphohydroxythreonine transaminase [Chengkuizengella sediminis]
MSNRAYNFNAGPAALPLEVLQKAQEELVDYQGIGMSVMEISHRSAEYERLNEETQELLSELLNIPSGYKTLFLQGGASTQFAMIPLNLLNAGKVSNYIITGSWGKKALKESKLVGETIVSAQPDKFSYIPDISQLQLQNHSAYLHITSNETIEGIQYQKFPDTGKIPLIADMSSDILCRPIDVSQFGMIYAGAQKNLGPSGVTLVVVREDLLENAPDHIPTMLRYDTHINANSLYNTPPVYSVYMVNLVLKWIKEKGGLDQIEKFNREKTKLIYDVIDESQGFYMGTVDKKDRSIMNIPFRLKNEQLEKQFLKQSQENGFVGLKGHRSVGGVRASTYNAVPYESCKALSDFMIEFQKNNG